MGRGVIKTAAVNSLNEFQFDFPYRGAQRATLTLRKHPQFGNDVILEIERGQFLCHRDCSVLVRLDEGKAQAFSVSKPEDHSTTALFIMNYNRFVASLRKAKHLYIEATFFQQGTRVTEFDVSGLNW